MSSFDANDWVSSFTGSGGSRAVAERMARRAQGLPVDEIKPAVQQPQDLFDSPPASPSPSTAVAVKPVRPPVVRRGRKPLPMNATPPTQQELDLFQLSMEIDQKNAKESGDLAFIATSMIYASLPHSEIEGGIYKRTNGITSLTIMNDPAIGLPYGKIPRIVTAFLCTEARKYHESRGPVVHLGKSQAELMHKLGMSANGGVRGNVPRFNEQIKRLLTSNITLIGQPGTEFHYKKVDISSQGMLLWNPHNIEEKSQWQTTLTLSQSFFDECKDHSVPVDMRVLQEMRSPLGIDIYIWLTYRYNSLKYKTPITWKQLKWQFGSNYSETPQGESDFKVNFKKQLRAVLAVYRDAKVEPTQDALILYPSKTHIPHDPR
ncbi:hypothetical protein RCH14_004536 [Massilia sp. MP_M2]|uniref:replication protein RepA n=1 Tax=Massilia sp. MP_M2 TaxID=3071713 RepID=UPI00319DEF78